MKALHWIILHLAAIGAFLLTYSGDGQSVVRGIGAVLVAVGGMAAAYHGGLTAAAKKAAVVLLFSLALGTTACAHVPPPIVNFGQCASEDIAPQVTAILAEVETDLASGNFMTLLADLAKRVGVTAVDCAVSTLLDKAKADQLAAKSDVISALVAVHAQAWLSR